MQFVTINPDTTTDSITVHNVLSDKYLVPTFYLSYDKMQKDEKKDEKKVKKRVAKYYYIKTVDRWLYHDHGFKELTKYFKIDKDNNGIKVSLIRNLKDLSDVTSFSHEEKKSILFFIETFFIDEKFIYKVIKSYTVKTSAKWYELYSFEYNIKEFIRHELKKKIKRTIIRMKETESGSKNNK